MKEIIKYSTIKPLVVAMCLTLIFSTISIPVVKAQETEGKITDEQINAEAQNVNNKFSPLLKLIEQMPEEVAEQGVEAGVEWLNLHKGEE